jgi:hypothetical protein
LADILVKLSCIFSMQRFIRPFITSMFNDSMSHPIKVKPIDRYSN